MDIKDRVMSFQSYSGELGLDLEKDDDRFKWFLASILFAKRISAEIAKRTYREIVKQGITTPESIMATDWDKLVKVLDSGGYVRYDFSTASNLVEMASTLKDRYGSLEKVYAESTDSKDLERKLLELKGVGPTVVNIFLRELKGIWDKARPQPSPLAREVAQRLQMRDEDLDLPAIESALVRINLELCKPKKCSICSFKDVCQQVRNFSNTQ